MTEPCLRLENLLAIAAGEREDPRRDHVRDCPRCRSRLKAYGLFTSLETQGACPGEERAVAQLTATLRDRIGVSESLPARPARVPWWTPRRLVPACGAAAILLGGFLLVQDDLRRPGGEPIAREAPASPLDAGLSPAPARPRADGALELSWSPVPGADAYRVRLLDAGLQELARFDAGARTSLALTAESLRAWSDRATYWHVQALAAGDPVADSAPQALPR